MLEINLHLLLGLEQTVHQKQYYHTNQTLSQLTTQLSITLRFCQILTTCLEHLRKCSSVGTKST